MLFRSFVGKGKFGIVKEGMGRRFSASGSAFDKTKVAVGGAKTAFSQFIKGTNDTDIQKLKADECCTQALKKDGPDIVAANAKVNDLDPLSRVIILLTSNVTIDDNTMFDTYKTDSAPLTEPTFNTNAKNAVDLILATPMLLTVLERMSIQIDPTKTSFDKSIEIADDTFVDDLGAKGAAAKDAAIEQFLLLVGLLKGDDELDGFIKKIEAHRSSAQPPKSIFMKAENEAALTKAIDTAKKHVAENKQIATEYTKYSAGVQAITEAINFKAKCIQYRDKKFSEVNPAPSAPEDDQYVINANILVNNAKFLGPIVQLINPTNNTATASAASCADAGKLTDTRLMKTTLTNHNKQLIAFFKALKANPDGIPILEHIDFNYNVTGVVDANSMGTRTTWTKFVSDIENSANAQDIDFEKLGIMYAYADGADASTLDAKKKEFFTAIRDVVLHKPENQAALDKILNDMSISKTKQTNPKLKNDPNQVQQSTQGNPPPNTTTEEKTVTDTLAALEKATTISEYKTTAPALIDALNALKLKGKYPDAKGNFSTNCDKAPFLAKIYGIDFDTTSGYKVNDQVSKAADAATVVDTIKVILSVTHGAMSSASEYLTLLEKLGLDKDLKAKPFIANGDKFILPLKDSGSDIKEIPCIFGVKKYEYVTGTTAIGNDEDRKKEFERIVNDQKFAPLLNEHILNRGIVLDEETFVEVISGKQRLVLNSQGKMEMQNKDASVATPSATPPQANSQNAPSSAPPQSQPPAPNAINNVYDCTDTIMFALNYEKVKDKYQPKTDAFKADKNYEYDKEKHELVEKEIPPLEDYNPLTKLLSPKARGVIRILGCDVKTTADTGEVAEMDKIEAALLDAYTKHFGNAQADSLALAELTIDKGNYIVKINPSKKINPETMPVPPYLNKLICMNGDILINGKPVKVDANKQDKEKIRTVVTTFNSTKKKMAIAENGGVLTVTIADLPQGEVKTLAQINMENLFLAHVHQHAKIYELDVKTIPKPNPPPQSKSSVDPDPAKNSTPQDLLKQSENQQLNGDPPGRHPGNAVPPLTSPKLEDLTASIKKLQTEVKKMEKDSNVSTDQVESFVTALKSLPGRLIPLVTESIKTVTGKISVAKVKAASTNFTTWIGKAIKKKKEDLNKVDFAKDALCCLVNYIQENKVTVSHRGGWEVIRNFFDRVATDQTFRDDMTNRLLNPDTADAAIEEIASLAEPGDYFEALHMAKILRALLVIVTFGVYYFATRGEYDPTQITERMTKLTGFAVTAEEAKTRVKAMIVDAAAEKVGVDSKFVDEVRSKIPKENVKKGEELKTAYDEFKKQLMNPPASAQPAPDDTKKSNDKASQGAEGDGKVTNPPATPDQPVAAPVGQAK